MLMLQEIREWVAGLGIASDENTYIGKLDAKKRHSIGVYQRPSSGQPNTALGGERYTSYGVRPISILVHWDKDKSASEAAACKLYEKIRNISSLDIGSTHINTIRLMVPEPQDVGTDDGGVYEYVIWLDFIYQRK